MVVKLALSISLIGFLTVAILLYLNHAGTALRITNYLFFVLAAGFTYELIFSKN